MNPFPWVCPYCGHTSTITAENHDIGWTSGLAVGAKQGEIRVEAEAIGCPNAECRGVVLTVCTQEWRQVAGIRGREFKWIEKKKWTLMPESSAKPFPDYIPASIRDAYSQAARIVAHSPNASAALSRRCLQGIVRDFWEIPENQRGNLGAEINYIKDKIDDELLKEIEAIRAIGDIGAHMDKYVNITVDVEPHEAELLVTLIETLITEWYVARQKKKERNAKLHGIVESKRAAQKAIKDGQKRQAESKQGPHTDQSDTSTE